MGSETHLFRKDDFVEFTKDSNRRMKTIIDRARAAENTRVQPTLKDRQKMTAILLDFVKSRGRIVYGGYAINEVVRAKDPADAIYDFETEAPDIEFYSSDAVIDARDLCNLFYAKGYRYVRGSEAMHAETYKVGVDLVQLCDITYVPKNVSRAIQYVTIDGVKYAHPHFMMIDSLRIITDPMASYWRLDKAFPRMYVLQKHYPLLRPHDHEVNLSRTCLSGIRPVIEASLKFMRDGLDADGSEIAILVGYAAFNRFTQWSGRGWNPEEEKQCIPFLEVIMTDFKKTVPKLFHYLVEKFPDRTVQYEEFQRFFDYCGRRGHIYVDGVLAVRMYHHNNRCTPILPKFDIPGDPLSHMESDTLRTATLSVTALYLMVNKLLCRIGLCSLTPDTRGQSVCESLIFELYSMRTEYLDSSNEDMTAEHPFQEFTSVCLGTTVGALRAHKEETEFRRSRLGLYGFAYFNYEPAQANNKADFNGYKYMNSSGNPILHTNDRWFTPPGAVVVYSDADIDADRDVNRDVNGSDGSPNRRSPGKNKNGQSPRNKKRRSPRNKNRRRQN